MENPIKMDVEPKIGVGPNPPKASIWFIGFSINCVHHPFWGETSPYFWVDTHIALVLSKTLVNPVDTEKLMKIPGLKRVMIVVIFPLWTRD